ncbi:MAG: sterol carrier protein domain-containing protein, partial [Planctomycetota bacterium]
MCLNSSSKPIGYIVYDSSETQGIVIEVGFATPAVFPDLLAQAVKLAKRKSADDIHFYLPEDDLFMGFCKPLELRKEILYRRDGQEMARMINIPSTMKKLAPMLSARMDGAGELTLRTNLEDVGLKWSKSGLKVVSPKRRGASVKLPQWALAQMIYGYRTASELAACGSITGPREAIGVLDEMF